MKVWHSLKAVAADPVPAPYVTVGTFDAVHLGHRALLSDLREMARQGRGAAVVVTFDEQPGTKKDPEGWQRLNYPDERLDLLCAAGVDGVLMLPFDDELRRKAADEFVEEVLVKALHARGVCVGYDHHFGHDGRGDISLLSLLGKKFSFETRAAAPFALDGMIVSSTLIRRKLREGDVAAANKFLGYRYGVRGAVEKGSGIGRSELGYPTANVVVEAKMLPAPGVYAALGNILGEEGLAAEGPFAAFLNLGFRPTFDGDSSGEPGLEVHLFDFSRDILGRCVGVQFVARLRDEEKFEDAAALRRQLVEDEKKARRILYSH
jgi:riboflavin kinase/FMN adenylyltransferase